MNGYQFDKCMQLAKLKKGAEQTKIIADAIFEKIVGRAPNTESQKDSEQLAIIMETIETTRYHFFKEEFKEPTYMASFF